MDNSNFPELMGKHDKRTMGEGLYEFFTMGYAILGIKNDADKWKDKLIGSMFGDRECIGVFYAKGKFFGVFKDK